MTPRFLRRTWVVLATAHRDHDPRATGLATSPPGVADLVPTRLRGADSSPLFCSGNHAREPHVYADFATQIAGRKSSMIALAVSEFLLVG